MTPRVRILACGAADGGDDAAALLATSRLPAALRGVAEVEPVGQLSPEQLLGDAPGMVRIVVDCVDGLRPGEILDLPLGAVPALEVRLGVASTHALPPGQAVALAAALGAVHPADRFLGLGGVAYELGAPLSPAVAEAMPELRRRIVLRAREAARRTDGAPAASR
jgi:hydrogenase maturation protease